MRPIMTWVLLADGTRARVLSNSGPGRGLSAVEGFAFQSDAPANRELESDRPGRTFQSHGVRRHTLGDNLGAHEQAEREFLDMVVEALASAHEKGSFARLILVAPPRALGTLRKRLPKSLASLVTGELPKDLVSLPDQQIPRHLADFLAV